MLITFKSSAAADVVMYENHAQPILALLHKDAQRGVITAAETAGAVATLETEIKRSKSDPQEAVPANANDSAIDPSADDHQDQTPQSVRFSTRAYPFLEMLRAANKAGKDVMWGV